MTYGVQFTNAVFFFFKNARPSGNVIQLADNEERILFLSSVLTKFRKGGGGGRGLLKPHKPLLLSLPVGYAAALPMVYLSPYFNER